MKRFINVWNRTSLIKRIIIGVILGFILGMTLPKVSAIGILGDLFVGGLKAVAPLLVFVLVASALSQNEKGQKTNMSTIIGLYLVGTLAAALVAVVVNYFFPITLTLDTATQPKLSSPEGVGQVFHSLLLQMVDNPINALGTANYIGVLTWAVIFGLAFRNSNKETKELLQTIADVTSQVVRWVINLAPFGILGLVFKTISDNGVKILANYGFLILALVGTMLFVALVINPFIAFLFMRKNPYPLVFRCLKDSGLTAFFTRSSAANIPVNMKLCEELGLNKDTYKVSIPLGATINMGGAAITINVLTLAAVNTLGIHVDFPTALLLSVLSAVSACGASGVTGGSLLLVPVACSLFGISNDLAMQVVGVGFIVGVVQDSCETALNSSTDVLFTAVAEKSVWGKKKKVN
ncbi:sodium:dicarboxylate symporter family protein [Streptococcus infantarius subsp. infantarius]|uniref:serine/threonine transporter SstT n=1 Tax=Streptococcus infantarius TaxID=102684 RepID=UPI001BDA1E56|nr:serine/threonine transporter SstT [Streptococcus infantarius]MBT0896214.1 serine/threonine transporter SstT [Streptococcus infantarius subsp. infantarius]MBT0899676.1 serine/threonine transporter SstT [Streptococcus infantarius subsp. infantarius]MBT1033317.1 serine/threonine transporter SstT [Streptococcus infantarius subsp. infantarius]MCO4466713.1 sodium:dicarboxylate symporter family protein [Streptococcus infantarius subsp. infantarius]MCO4475959.1 sodium:dicarboxylate symporter family